MMAAWWPLAVALVLLLACSTALVRARRQLQEARRHLPYLRKHADDMVQAQLDQNVGCLLYTYENGLLYNLDALERTLSGGDERLPLPPSHDAS